MINLILTVGISGYVVSAYGDRSARQTNTAPVFIRTPGLCAFGEYLLIY